ncbi:MAG: FliM/FliN family flagellar motor switch protein [Planctomycetota bacterium]|nr:FliM/FliN family flagellar motor switch protein [Planctomycetota bacterium]
MATFSKEFASKIFAQADGATVEIAQALTRTLDRPIAVQFAEARPIDLAELEKSLVGPGLAVLLVVQSQAAVLLIPEAGKVLPAWYAKPDATGQSKLATLAQELSILLLPDELAVDDSRAVRVEDLSAALRAGHVSEDGFILPMELNSGVQRCGSWFVWPLTSAAKFLATAAKVTDATPAVDQTKTEPALATPTTPATAATSTVHTQQPNPTISPATPVSDSQKVADIVPPEAQTVTARGDIESKPAGRSLADLPPYTRSLLKIRVPLTVTLASKKQPVGHILEIGPGSIIQFDKSCEDMLDLNVGNLPIARGETVKVGEKFGLRVLSLILPEERFQAIKTG